MMSLRNKRCIYNKNHILTIVDKNKGQILERNLNLSINNFDESLEIKLRDPFEYTFNYSESITPSTYDVMRINQNLDINFIEFKSNLLEMLHQFETRELYLKCEVSEEICTVIFYGRSKIKSLVFLTLDLLATNQKEILAELIGSMQDIQGLNEKLKKQLSFMKNAAHEKETEMKHMEFLKEQLQNQFFQNLKQLEGVFNKKFMEVEQLLANKLFLAEQKIIKLLKDVDILKKDFLTKSEADSNMIKSMENLKLESINKNSMINNLRIENSTLTAEKINFERCINDLKKKLNDNEIHNDELIRKNEELHKDLEKATIILSQKKSTIEELSQDLLQANQMLVNFNKHYDEKVKQLEDLESILKSKEDALTDERIKHQTVLNEFDQYKNMFNSAIQENMSEELSVARNKIIELENTIRKVNKINTLLTEKVNEFGFPLHKKY